MHGALFLYGYVEYDQITQDTLAESLSALLAHPSYGVRFEAAVALASLGSALPWCAAGLLQQVIARCIIKSCSTEASPSHPGGVMVQLTPLG